MESIRKWFYRPKRDDTSLLAQFFYANEALTAVASELDSFDGRQEPERCTTLVNQLRHCQDKVLTICNQIMDELIPDSRANRDFRVKFPDDVMQENLAGQLWFGAECLAAGSSIMNREVESSAMRPLAKALTKSLEIVRNLLREHALKGHLNLKAQNPLEPSLEKLIESLKIFDRLFADFELCYVAAMVPVKSTKEYEQQELVCVLFSETLQRALERGLLNQADVDNYEPALMFTIPRLAIVSGLLASPGGPLCLNSPDTISEMFRPFRNLLLKIRELLWTLNNRELYMLEKLLCSNEEPTAPITQTNKNSCHQDLEEFVHNFYTDYPSCKDFIVDFYTVTKNNGTNMDETANDAVETIEDNHQDNQEKIEYLIEKKLQPERDKNKRIRKQKISKNDNINICVNEISSNSNDNNSNNVNQVLGIFEEDNRHDNSDQSEHNCQRIVDTISNNNNTIIINECPSSSSNSSGDVGVSGSDTHQNNNSTRRNDNFLSSDISQILGTTENIEIPQTQYLLNQVSHENNVTGETINIENSLPDMDSRKLISEANKTLSNLLLEGECQNEISEQTDSGICTVISSENTSLYDKSPEEKKTFTNIINDNVNDDDDNDNNTNNNDFDETPSSSSSSSSSLSPSSSSSSSSSSGNKIYIKKNDCETINDTCDAESIKNNELDNNQIDNNNFDSNETSKNIDCISSNFNGTNEEFVGIAYGNGQITVCDSNPSTFQINYSENWENLNINIDNKNDTAKEFWNDIKCKNCPSTSHDINKINNYTQERIPSRRLKDIKGSSSSSGGGSSKKRHHQRKFDRKISKRNYDDTHRSLSCNVRTLRLAQSTESSRSNSTDRCLRLSTFGASLHPSQNTRQMPNFGSHSPQRSPRLCHFEPRNDNYTMRNYNFGHRNHTSSSSPQNRKLLDHRRSRSEQIAKMRKRDITDRKENKTKNINIDKRKKINNNNNIEKHDKLPNDGLGPRTDKSGLSLESPTTDNIDTTIEQHHHHHPDDTRRQRKTGSLVNPNVIARATAPVLELALNRHDIPSSSSCSSCCDSSSETSEFQSDCQDDEEIALAMQAAEIANRNQVRAKFRSSEDLVHRLFVCIAGVADQLQTNFASDLRNILKCVFLMNSTEIDTNEEQLLSNQSGQTDVIENTEIPERNNTNNNNNMNIIERQNSLGEDEEDELEDANNERTSPVTECGEECVERAPAWIPDNDAPRCMACQAGFTVVRRRHHCRNCGKVFCGRCSSNNVPLPRYGHTKPVRVCNRCFLYQVTPFTVSQVTS